MATQVTFRLPDNTTIRSATQRAFVLISQWVDPDNGKVHARIEKRSDSRETLRKEFMRRVGRGTGCRWFLGVSATREVQTLL